MLTSFNPRTYIRYDMLHISNKYLYFVFQSTYLYKVRLCKEVDYFHRYGFNPRTYIRYDFGHRALLPFKFCFNPRTYIRYDFSVYSAWALVNCFNPRTYIRYDWFPVCLLLLRILFQSTYLYKVRQA